MKNQLIFPGSMIPGKSTEEILAYASADTSLLSYSTRSEYQVGLMAGSIVATSGRSPLRTSKAYHLLYFYGNGMCLETSVQDVSYFQQLGFNVLIPEYLGYGISSGNVSEAGCYETADAAYHYLTVTRHVDPSQIIACGWSLGAAVAIDLAARKPVAGLVSISAFTNLVNQAHAMLPWVPCSLIRLCVSERFDNLSKIRHVSCPVFIAHGTQDELIPFAMAEQLAHLAQTRVPVTFFPLEGCGHNDIFEVRGNVLGSAIQAFRESI